MEELQDAIEDAQYMDAMLDDAPKPSKEWSWMSQPDLERFINKLKAENPSALELETMCQGSLGLYLFMKFAREQGSQVLSEFIMELASLRTINTPNIIHLVRKIITNYILNGSTGNANFTKGPPTLARVIPAENAPTKHNISNLYETRDSSNALGVSGSCIDTILAGFGPSKVTHNNTLGIAAATHVFDELDCVVFHILKQRHQEAFMQSADWFKYFQFVAMSERKLSEEEDFLLLRVVGRGGFGQVNACKKATTGKLYAMKCMAKKRIKLKKAEKMVLMEKNIMTTVNSPYVVCLKYSFSTRDDLYLVLDLMIGGDLGYHLSKKMKFSMKESKYYASRILLGIAALHDRKIVYRDLKPENVLMDSDGYTKISDLGLACKMESGGITGTCGTRGYWAPEMLRKREDGKRERYTLAVDWFSFGCLLYEFLVGVSPFRTERAKKWGDFGNNNNGKSEKGEKDKSIDLATLEMDPDYSSISDADTVDLLQKLLAKQAKDRIGFAHYEEIIAHPWFSEVPWDNMHTDKPPMKPGKDLNVATQSEIGAFSDAKATKKVQLTPEDQKLYGEWDFTSQSAFQEEIVEFLTYEEKNGPIRPTNVDQRCCTVS